MATAKTSLAPDAVHGSPTFPPPHPPGLTPVLQRNIRALEERRRQEESTATLEQRIAQAITDFTGSMLFVYLHLAMFGFWILANLGWIPIVTPWDPSFVVLAMIASVEAIFLSTFVLISQNRISAAADKRANLDLQVSLLAEHEITKIAELLSAVADQMGIKSASNAEMDEVKRNVAPEAVLEELEASNKASNNG